MSSHPPHSAAPLRATYRVQLHAGFTLDAAAALAAYLADLGVSHLYCSPYLQAAPGSTHGYDVVNPHAVNRELGGDQGHARLGAALAAHGLGQVLDVVPNHMAISAENPWWWDVLENGPSSRYALYFDVDWDPPEARHSNEVLVPVLGDHYGRVLEAGEIKLELADNRFIIRYYDNIYPVDPRSLGSLLASAAERSPVGRVSDTLLFLGRAFDRLPQATALDRSNAARRYQEQAVLFDLLARLRAAHPEVQAALDEAVAALNADPDALDVLLELQNYRLAFWRIAHRELGYRRFFDVTTLIGLRTEDEVVYRDTHALVLGWLAGGVLDGLRIDHPDGLRDPEQYFRRLRESSPGAWIVAEKILEPGEALPDTWPVDGTTGYDFMRLLNGLFTDPRGEAPLTEFYTFFTGVTADYGLIMRDKKRQVMRDVLGSDVNRLTALLLQVCERHRRYRDYTRPTLREALTEVAAWLPVYRTYARPGAEGELPQVSAADAAHLAEAMAAAKESRPDIDAELFDFLQDLLLLRLPGTVEAELAARFQQFTGPVMAKGVEDTAFYNYYRLVSLNEVGGHPGQFGLSPDEFHAECAARQARQPRAMLATSTHDTKRSEDVRARLNVLSEIPAEWTEAVMRWAALNEPLRQDGQPSRNDEYLLYQTLVGAWPIEVERVLQYMEKAGREAKADTSWTNPNPAYEQAVAAFVRGALANSDFVAELEAFVARVREPGWVKSLAQTLLKLTAPGVPDIYQGTELWDYSLVDPDNRRPVDYARRRQLLAEIAQGDLSPEQVWERRAEGLPKLWLICRTLGLRRRRPEWFGPDAVYQPLQVHAPGAAANSAPGPGTAETTVLAGPPALAFRRGPVSGGGLITVVPRLTLANNDGATLNLPPGQWHNELTGESLSGGEIRLAALFVRFPTALLHAE